MLYSYFIWIYMLYIKNGVAETLQYYILSIEAYEVQYITKTAVYCKANSWRGLYKLQPIGLLAYHYYYYYFIALIFTCSPATWAFGNVI